MIHDCTHMVMFHSYLNQGRPYSSSNTTISSSVNVKSSFKSKGTSPALSAV
jgi:hypothetical protein